MHADHFFDLVPLRYGLKYGAKRAAERMPLWLPLGRPRDARGAAPDRRARRQRRFLRRRLRDSRVRSRGGAEIGGAALDAFATRRHYVDAFAIRADCDGRSLTYSADTAPSEAVAEHARGSALFLCEAALELGTEEGERGHMSASEAGEMARRADVGRLVLTHYPAAAAPQALVAAAKETFLGSGRMRGRRPRADVFKVRRS